MTNVVNKYGKIDLTGIKFGRLTVIREMPERVHRWKIKWMCRCECGNEKVIAGGTLKSGQAKSCGCLSAETSKTRNVIHGHNRRSGSSAEYNTWCNMKYRCYNENYKEFYIYGGRGIKVCDRWLNSFENFLLDMGVKPTPQHSIDRFPDFNGNYTPDNCRWATKKEQGQCKRNNVWYEHNGVKMVASDWAKHFKISQSNLSQMVSKKKSFEAVYDYYNNKYKLKN